MGAGKRRDLIKVGRNLETDHHFFQPVMKIRNQYFGANFEVQGPDGERDPAQTLKWRRLVRDVWQEFLLADSVVILWQDGGIPAAMNGEDVEYENKFGQEKVTIRLGTQKVSKELRKSLGEKLANALERDGKVEVLNGKTGTLNCRVLTLAKDGAGLAWPSMKAAMMDLAIIELLKIGEWNGAFARRNLVRQAKKGHEIKSGNLAGQPLHFYKTAFGKQLFKFLSEKIGYSELVGNFDLEFEYVFLPADFFDPKIYEAVHRRLMIWAGGAGLIAESSDKSDERFARGLDMLRNESLASRSLVSGFLEEVFSKFPGWTAGNRVAFSNSVFFTGKQLLAYVSQAATNGHMSPQTAREWLGLNEQVESRRMKESRDHVENYTPPFEAKQGMQTPGSAAPPTTAGGRPSGASSSQ